MKTRIIRSTFSLLALLAFLPLNKAYAIGNEHNQTVIKAYRITPESTVYINNKYGKIHVSNWEKDSVRFEINLKIRSSSPSRVVRMRSNISFDFVITKYNISATTVFGSTSSSFFNEIRNLAESIVSTDNQVIIDYYVSLPVWANLNIDNKFGDIYLDDCEGELTLNHSNGILRANKLSGQTNLTLGTSNADINHIEKGRLNFSYANVNIKKTNRIDLTSRSSKISIDEADYIKLDSRRDKLNVIKMDRSFGDTYFSDIRIEELHDEVSYNMRYGALYVDKVKKIFSLINVSSEYTDITLNFDRNMTYNFDMVHFNETIFQYPRELSNLQEKLTNVERKEFLIFGTIGPAASSKSKVNIKTLKKCYVKLEHKN